MYVWDLLIWIVSIYIRKTRDTFRSPVLTSAVCHHDQDRFLTMKVLILSIQNLWF